MIPIPFIGTLVSIMGWNIDSTQSSKSLLAPEIILQTANVNEYTILIDNQRIIDDGIIAERASLAKALLDDPSCPRENKTFIGIPEQHNYPLSNIEFSAERMEQYLEA